MSCCKNTLCCSSKTVEQEGKFQVQEQETLPDGTVRIKVGRWV